MLARRLALLLAAWAALAGAATAPAQDAQEVQDAQHAQDPPPRRPRVLFLTESAGFQHDVVKRPDAAQLSLAERALREAAAGRFDVRATQDGARLSPQTFQEADVVVFYTTGELPLTGETRGALLAAVRQGLGFVGVHSATDTFYELPPYAEMLGGVFDGHPWHQEVSITVEDGTHPATAHLGDSWRHHDEIYQFRDFRRHPLHVLLSLDPGSVDIDLGQRADGDYALAWCKPYGRGRVFYTALGHRPEVWEDAAFLEHLLGGIAWAAEGPDHPQAAPPGAVVLLGAGASDDALAHRDGDPLGWEPVDGAWQVGAGLGDVVSRETFGDHLLHVEFRLPRRDDGPDPGWGNSGVYVHGRYELQVLRDVLNPNEHGTCGAIYGQKSPDYPAQRIPGRWQTYDVRFRAPRLDGDGQVVERARLSLWHNGLLVHDDVELTGPTPGGVGEDEVARGPLLLQDHGDPVRFRNVWVLPLDD